MSDLIPFVPDHTYVGKLLVASSLVADPVLSRSVSLVVHQDPKQIFAVMLNRPMSPHPAALLQMLHDQAGESQTDLNAGLATDSGEDGDPATPSDRVGHLASQAKQTAAEAAAAVGTVHFGGPLSGPVVAVHGASEFAEAETGNGVYVAAQRQLLERLVKQKPGPFRLIVGHLGWGVAQFEMERHAGLWHVIDATSEAVFSNDVDMWPGLIHRATSSSVASWLGIPDLPNAAAYN
ncbi:YqgE/AlgH family protein [Stieleria varia]|uniref:Uncharacterized protein n=1 Tax=Stieleria varia TaxID=2528005 RepID=A0A5C6B434_9BACT|nr:YqgE/AlgH family protein [Stieleria varia]TWU06251.1 hypothetical protein Pla52n_19720 [Stieleria varia]